MSACFAMHGTKAILSSMIPPFSSWRGALSRVVHLPGCSSFMKKKFIFGNKIRERNGRFYSRIVSLEYEGYVFFFLATQ